MGRGVGSQTPYIRRMGRAADNQTDKLIEELEASRGLDPELDSELDELLEGASHEAGVGVHCRGARAVWAPRGDQP